ncbi:hypothetical protein [Roseivirga echinicomitans]|uniref:hypothetical protein n=1 Tax=Roseivirga echinicomitans TaxID=296218 RepID=UPI00155ED6E3|nr:hypothetical protein [Roseivirga echinicomitans]
MTISSCLLKTKPTTLGWEKSLNQLEKELTNSKVLNKRKKKDYRKLLSLAKFKKLKLKPEYYTITEYINPDNYSHCSPNSIIENTNEEARTVFLYTVYAALSQKIATINLTVFEDGNIQIEGLESSIDDFKERILNEISKRDVPKEKIVFNLSVNPEMRMGMLIDIQTIITEIGVGRIYYRDLKIDKR